MNSWPRAIYIRARLGGELTGITSLLSVVSELEPFLGEQSRALSILGKGVFFFPKPCMGKLLRGKTEHF